MVVGLDLLNTPDEAIAVSRAVEVRMVIGCSCRPEAMHLGPDVAEDGGSPVKTGGGSAVGLCELIETLLSRDPFVAPVTS